MTTISVRPEPVVRPQPARAEQHLGLSARSEGNLWVVRLAGELDLASRDQLFRVCTVPHDLSVVVDLSELIFMDCFGYGGITAARSVVEADDRTLTVRSATGEPARLLGLIADLEAQRPGAIGLARVDLTSTSSTRWRPCRTSHDPVR
ncbi:MAG: STAS domain-containing protein [Ilumatobacteraceae bacterium]